MAMTPYGQSPLVISILGTTPQERGLETQQFKAKFDEGLKGFVEWFNLTHKTEFEAVQTDIETHKAENVTKLIPITRNLSIIGQQVITGVGFRPKAVVVIGAVGGVAGKGSWGLSSEGSGQYVVYDFANQAAGSYRAYAPSIFSIQESLNNATHCAVVSYDADGLTLNWSKEGTGATGTADIYILAVSHY